MMMADDTEFQNIDLDTSMCQDSVDQSEIEPEPTKAPDNVISVPKNEYLEQLSRQLIDDYSRYFQLKPTVQIDELNESIDNLLTHMEEFYGLIEMIRSESNYCLDQYTMVLIPKMKNLKKVYGLIDKLERIVNHVSMQVSLMENEVSRAEKMMGTQNSVATSTMKKIFSFFGGGGNSDPSSQPKYKYVPPDIFKTSDLFDL